MQPTARRSSRPPGRPHQSRLSSGCAWRHLPPAFGTSSATAHRRFTVWTETGLWRRLHRAALDELGARDEADWTWAIVDVASVRAKRGDR
ncbi:transposase [Streptomyces spiralis]|uniref:transposase n=1 Tax=Streptomyces spiralis TaxID=66376 RepID=UPI0033DFC9F6